MSEFSRQAIAQLLCIRGITAFLRPHPTRGECLTFGGVNVRATPSLQLFEDLESFNLKEKEVTTTLYMLHGGKVNASTV